MTKIRLAIAGMGNCASSLVQGIEYYRDADPDDAVPGLMHVDLGGYHVGDIELVAAFDVDANKVGLDASKAIFAEIRTTRSSSPTLPHLGVRSSGARPSTASASTTGRCAGVPGRARRRGPGAARHRRRRARVVPAGRLRGGPEGTTPRRASTPAWPS
jgi:hypothetical protein